MPALEGLRRVGPWHVLGVALVAQIGISTIDQGLATLTGFLKADFGLSAGAVGLVIAAFPFGRFFGAYAAGVIADRLGERIVILGGGAATSAAVAVAAGLPLAGLVTVLFLAGIVSAGSTPAGGRLVLTAFPRHRHGLALGIRQTAIPIGGLAGAAALPWLAHEYSWRWSLVAVAVFGAATLVPLVGARTIGRETERPALAHGPSPVRDRNIRLIIAWGCCVSSGAVALIAFLALDLNHSAGLSLVTASFLLVVAQAAGIVGRIAWGALSDSLIGRGRKPVMVAITVVALAAAIALAAVPRSGSVGAYAPVAALAGLGLIGYQGLWVTLIAEAAGPARVGAASGLGVMFATLTAAVSPPLYGLIADVTGSYRSIWIAVCAVIVLSFVPATLLREPAAQPPGGSSRFT